MEKQQPERLRNFLATGLITSIPKEQWGVHRTHCCVEHGCKYGDGDCPVVLGIIAQDCYCEDCDDDVIIPIASNQLYAFLYNDSIHESSWATVSLHYSKEGAEKAMNEHKQKALDEFNEEDESFEKKFGFGRFQDWRVVSINVLP